MVEQRTTKNSIGKIISLYEAVAKYVRDGCHISLGGATANRNPMAAVYEIIRQKKRNLHLYGHILGTGPDLLIGAGCVDYVECGYFGVGRFAPTAPCFRRAVAEGDLRFEDYTNFQMVSRFLAGALGIPFIPTFSGYGSDIIRLWGISREERQMNPSLALLKLVEMSNPFDRNESPEKVLLLPAINTDVTIVHAQKADQHGNGRVEGLTFADVEQIKCAKYTILSCEEIVETDHLISNPELNQIPAFFVDCVVHVPYGAHPTQCYNYYDYDADFLYKLKEVSENGDKFLRFLDEYVFELKDFDEYLAKVGTKTLQSIRADSKYGYSKVLDRKIKNDL